MNMLLVFQWQLTLDKMPSGFKVLKKRAVNIGITPKTRRQKYRSTFRSGFEINFNILNKNGLHVMCLTFASIVHMMCL